MPTILTSGETVISPNVCLAIQTEREPGSIVHDIIGRTTPDVTLRAATTRRGTLRLGFLDETSELDSAAAEVALADTGVWTIVSSERESLAFSFIVRGRLSRMLDGTTRNAWIVEVEFREVSL